MAGQCSRSGLSQKRTLTKSRSVLDAWWHLLGSPWDDLGWWHLASYPLTFFYSHSVSKEIRAVAKLRRSLQFQQWLAPLSFCRTFLFSSSTITTHLLESLADQFVMWKREKGAGLTSQKCERQKIALDQGSKPITIKLGDIFLFVCKSTLKATLRGILKMLWAIMVCD